MDIDSLNLPSTSTNQLKPEYNPFEIKEKEGSLNVTSAPKTITALELYNEEVLNGSVLSYNEAIDSLLKEVILPNTVTELAGDSGCGKTQLCFQLIISVQLPKWCGGIAGEAIYIDTNNNFASHRVTELAMNFIKKYSHIKPSVEVPDTKFDINYILQHIHYTKISCITQLLACINHIKSNMSTKQVRLLVIDSLSYIIRTTETKNRTTLINKIVFSLRSLCKEQNIAVIITNNLTTRVNKGESYVTPSFGDSFYHLVNSRILLCKKSNNLFHAKLEKNILHDQKDTIFYL